MFLTHIVNLVSIVLVLYSQDIIAKDLVMKMQLLSAAFANGQSIPIKYTCKGKNISPALSWSNIPAVAKSLVLVVDDPDAPDPKAPKLTWIHWVLYNIPATSFGFPEGVARNQLPAGTLEGLNSWNKTGYGGPCPPIGEHRYFHKLYALDIVLPDLAKPNIDKLEESIKGHILEQVEIIGTYAAE